jgi:hypothetical protein
MLAESCRACSRITGSVAASSDLKSGGTLELLIRGKSFRRPQMCKEYSGVPSTHRVLGPAAMLVASSHGRLTFDGLLLFSRLISRCLRCPTTISLMLRPNAAKNSSSRISIALSMDRSARARTDLMGNSYIHCEVSHPVRFRHRKDVWMVAKAPRKNASSRSRRAHYENWSINLLVHFNVPWERRSHCPFAMALIERWAVGASRNCLRSSEGDPEKRLEDAAYDNG